MISRNWRGVARREEATNYVHHLEHETFPQLSGIDGFVSASILRRDTDAGVEFLIVTTWRSMEAIRQFAGEAVEVAVVPPAVRAMMVEYDQEVAHYEVVGTYRPE
jgi:heme-degrading monooxygenase HmoA